MGVAVVKPGDHEAIPTLEHSIAGPRLGRNTLADLRDVVAL
jgi:hypothetical protein